MSSSRSSSIKAPKSPIIPQTARSPRSPPLPHLDDPPAPHPDPPEQDPPLDEALADYEDEIPYPEPSSEQTILPPPNFNPFFTLIDDTTSGEHYHPYVHYVFADDDPVIVTAAAMRSMGLDDTHYLPETTPDPEHQEHRSMQHEDEEQAAQEPDTQVESPLPPPIPGVKERYLIIDVAADGHSVVDAQSLSPEWQITNANVRSAPSFADEEAEDHAYMLRIEGVEVPAKSKGKAKGEPGESKLEDAMGKVAGDVFAAMEGLVKGIEGGLEVAEKIIGREDKDVRESERTVVGPALAGDIGEGKGKGKASGEG